MKYTGYIKRYSFIPLSDTAELEEYFSQNAERGLFVCEFLSFGRLRFRVAAPRSMRYAVRVIPAAGTEALTAAASENGWERVCVRKCARGRYAIAVFMSDDKDAVFPSGDENASDVFVASSVQCWCVLITAVAAAVQLPVYAAAFYNQPLFYRSFPGVFYFTALLFALMSLVVFRALRKNRKKPVAAKRGMLAGKLFLAGFTAVIIALLAADAVVSQSRVSYDIPDEIISMGIYGSGDNGAEITREYYVSYGRNFFIRRGFEYEQTAENGRVWVRCIRYTGKCVAQSAYEKIASGSIMYRGAVWSSLPSGDGGAVKTTALSDGTEATVRITEDTVYEIWVYKLPDTE